MQPTIRFERISKRYRLGLTRTSVPTLVKEQLQRLGRRPARSARGSDYLWALRDVSFDLQPGESMALVGPNGAGKTTVLKLLANITRPTSGQLETRGRLSALIELGAGFHPDLTGRENIFLNGTILGLRRHEIERRLDEIIDFSELERFIETPVKRYSSGMKVRLGFAVAACVEPEILLVDEVLAVGDAAFRQKCLERISRLIEQGASIIFVSHNLYLVQAVCQKGLYLDHGIVKSLGPTREIISRYEDDLHQQRARALHRPGESEESGVASDPAAGEIDIVRVEVVPGGGQGDDDDGSLHGDRPAEVRIDYHAYRDFPGVHVAVHLMRADGLTCCMMRTSLDGVRIGLRRGNGTVVVRLEPLQLMGGAYFAEAHFLNDSDSMVIRSASSDWFSVSSRGLSYEDRSGVYTPRTRWRHETSAAPAAAPDNAAYSQ